MFSGVAFENSLLHDSAVSEKKISRNKSSEFRSFKITFMAS